MKKRGKAVCFYYFKLCQNEMVKKIASLHHMPNKSIIRKALVD